LREVWLNPPDLVKREPEVVPHPAQGCEGGGDPEEAHADQSL
jgi:hypothetical protein